MEFDFTQEPGKEIYDRQLITEEKPLVSVVTPYYNAFKYFEALYSCVMNQTFSWFEWIIVDDGSNKEEDIQLLSELESRDSRIRVVHKPNGGISSARNRGIKESTTEIIITLDADEMIEPTYFEMLYWALYYNPECAWAYTDSLGFQNQEYVWQYPFDAQKLKTYNFLVESAAIRKKDLLEVGCYDEAEKHYYEDWRLWLKLLSKSKRPVRISSLEFWYRRTDSGVLNIVNTNDEIKKRADQLISEAAEHVDTSITAKMFGGYLKKDAFYLPKKTEFNKLYYAEKNKTHILFLIPWMVTGGADQFNLDFVRLLNKDKYRVTILTTVNSENEWKQKFRKYTPEVFTLPDFLDTENYSEFISYIIQTRQIDVCLISNSYFGYYLAPWLRREYPEMAIIDYVHMEEMYWRNGGYARSSMGMSDVIEKTYVCNESTRRNFLEKFNRNEDSVETIYIGVDQEKYNSANVEYGTVREKYKISGKEKIVLFPCRLHAQKRPYLMVEIAKEVVRKNKNIKFLIAGDGGELEGIKKKAEEYRLTHNIIFAGLQENMLPFYKDSDLTLICSIREGLSLTAYESCAMMTPVVTADVGGQKELIDSSVGRVIPMLQKEEDINILSYSPEEVNQYVEAILELLSPDNEKTYQRMCLACREKIEKSFGLDTMIRKMEAAVEECLTEERRAERRKKAELLQNLPYLSEDIFSMYIAYESMWQESVRNWNALCLNSGNGYIGSANSEMEKRMQMLWKENYDIWNSKSYAIGRAITWIPRKIKRVISYAREHGVRNTLRRILKK